MNVEKGTTIELLTAVKQTQTYHDIELVDLTISVHIISLCIGNLNIEFSDRESTLQPVDSLTIGSLVIQLVLMICMYCLCHKNASTPQHSLEHN